MEKEKIIRVYDNETLIKETVIKSEVRGYSENHGVKIPTINVIIVVADDEMATTIAKSIPNSVIAGKVIGHIKETGKSGLVGVISDFLAEGY